MRRQAMEKQRTRRRVPHQPLVDAEGLQQAVAVAFPIVAHRHPGVGEDGVGTGHGGHGIVAGAAALVRSGPIQQAAGASSGGVAMLR